MRTRIITMYQHVKDRANRARPQAAWLVQERKVKVLFQTLLRRSRFSKRSFKQHCNHDFKNRIASAKVERIKKVWFKLLCIVNYKVNFALFIVNFAIPSAFRSLSAIIF